MSATDGLNDLELRNEDGSDNNEGNPEWGIAGSPIINLAGQQYYEDGIGEPRDNANPRDVSNAVSAQDGDTPNTAGLSNFFTFFGQFIDHDIDLTTAGTGEHISITVPNNDGIFPEGTELSIERSGFVDGTGVDDTPRQYPNAITSFADASSIYGSNATLTNLLRANDGGGEKSAYLLTGENDGLPTLDEVQAANMGADLSGLVDNPTNAGNVLIAGDIRVNENVALSTMHTVWTREHNHQVDRLRDEHPGWSEDELFNGARIIVEAEYQHIVFNEYLPLLLGAENIPDYAGYNSDIDPSIASEFSTAAYRLGHSQLSSTLNRTNEDGSESALGDLNLFQAFFNPSELDDPDSVNALVRGLASGDSQEIDTKIVDDVRNLLFGNIEEGQGTDLGVLNILRGRDHGIPTLNDMRTALGLDAYQNFSELTSDALLAEAFEEVYGNINKVELWIGGLAEDKVPGSQLGSTFHTIVLDQFMRLRDGDRFYFEERLQDNPELLAEVMDVSLSDILLRNTDIDYLQDDVFITHNRIGGTDGWDYLVGTNDHDLIIGFDGNDTLRGKQGDDDLYGGAGRDYLHGGKGHDVLNGEGGNDRIYGGRGDDDIRGGGGNDHIDTGRGNDVVDGGDGKDKIYARGTGDKTIDGGDGNDKIYAGRGDDDLYGGNGRDHIHAGNGSNLINGGGGNDKMWAGRDDDTFVFEKHSGVDKIYGFNVWEDVLDVSDYGFASFNEVEDAISRKGWNTTIIELDDESGAKVQLVGVRSHQLDADNFIFDDDNAVV